MKKIILFLLILVLSQIAYGQKMYFDIGTTRIKDSTGYTTMNRSLLLYKNLFVKGEVLFDTLGTGKIYYDGVNIAFQNTKQYGGFNFELGEKNSSIFVSKSSGGTGLPILTIDSTGLNISTGMTYKINGTPISGSGTTNLYGYAYKDSNNTFTKHNKFNRLTLWTSSTDSVQFTTAGLGSGNLIITPVGTDVTLGTTSGTGTKNIYAGEYYRGSTLLTTYFNTNTTFSNIPYLNKKNDFTVQNTFSGVDSSIVAKGLKGFTGETYLGLISPGNGYNGIKIYNYSTAGTIFFYTANGSAQYTMDNNGFWVGDGTTGKPYLTHGAPTTSAVSYTFYGDLNTGLLRNSADNISLITGGSDRFNLTTSAITSTLPVIISGTTSYFKITPITSTQRDALTPTEGMQIMNGTTHKMQVYDGTTWVDLH